MTNRNTFRINLYSMQTPKIREKSVGTTELHYSTKKRYHVLTILKSFFSSDTRQSMKRQIATER